MGYPPGGVVCTTYHLLLHALQVVGVYHQCTTYCVCHDARDASDLSDVTVSTRSTTYDVQYLVP